MPSRGREAHVERFKQLTEVELPAKAREQRWPIRFDHCFKRICLDYAYGDVWYKHLKKPAEKNIDGDPLRHAIACAEEILAGGLTLLRERNNASLSYRGKLTKSAPATAL